MIDLTKSGYEKFIKGTLHLANDTKVVILSGGVVTNDTFDTSTINTLRAAANTNDREFPFYDFEAIQHSDDQIKIKAQVNFNTKDFVEKGDENVDLNAGIIDTTDGDDLVGTILLYPPTDPITYSALNSAPVNIDYRGSGLAFMTFKSSYTSSIINYSITGRTVNHSNTFIHSILNLPIFDNTTQTNLLSDMKIALLSSNIVESSQATHQSRIHTASQTMSTIENLDSHTNFTYISGGFEFRNLGLATGAGFAALTATDSTIYIPGLTINTEQCFAVIYYEDTAVISPGDDPMTTQYKQNTYVLNNVHNITTTRGNDRFAFKQSVIIDSIFDPSALVNSSNEQAGIMALNNTVGPGLKHSNI